MYFLANGYKQGLISELQNTNFNETQINEIVSKATILFLANLKFTL